MQDPRGGLPSLPLSLSHTRTHTHSLSLEVSFSLFWAGSDGMNDTWGVLPGLDQRPRRLPRPGLHQKGQMPADEREKGGERQHEKGRENGGGREREREIVILPFDHIEPQTSIIWCLVHQICTRKCRHANSPRGNFAFKETKLTHYRVAPRNHRHCLTEGPRVPTSN